MSELGLLIKSKNITWAQIEGYLKAKGTDASTISTLQTVFEEETGVSSDTRQRLDIGNDGTSIYDNSYNNVSLDEADNVFQEADPSIRKTEGNTDKVTVSQKNKNLLIDAVKELAKESDNTNPTDTTGTVQYIPQINYQPQFNYNFTPINFGNMDFNNPFGMTSFTFDGNTNQTDFGQGTNFLNLNFDYTPYNPTYPQPNTPNYNFSGITFDSPSYNYPNFDFNTPITVNPYTPDNTQPRDVQPRVNQPVDTPSARDNASGNEGREIRRDEPPREEPETYPKKVKELIDGLIQENVEYSVEKTSKGYKITVSSGSNLESIDAKSAVYEFSKRGVLRKSTTEYNNGTTLKTTLGTPPRNVLYDSDIDERIVTVAENISKFENPSQKTTLTHGDDGGYTITQTDFDNEDIKEIETVLTKEPWQKASGESSGYTSDSDYIKRQKITYKDGHEEIITYEKGQIKSRETVKSLEQIEEEHADTPPIRLRTATKISFDLPADANNDCREFANALCSEKERLMKELGLDNDTYNELAQTAMAIAEKETQMNKIGITNRLWWKDKAHGIISDIQGGDQNCSTGIAQIKLGQWYNNPPKNEEQARLKPFFENSGITTPDDLKNNKKAAIATIIALSSLNRELRAERYKKGVEKAEQLTVTREKWELDSDGIARETGHTRPWKNEITKQDQLLLLWNNKDGRKILANGTFKPQTEGFMYMNVARKANLKYKLVEDPESRRLAEEKERELLIRDEETKPYKDMTLNGPMGEVVFMAGMYKNNAQFVNSKQEIEALKKALDQKGIYGSDVTEFIKAIENKELGFGHKLTAKEIDSLTKSDIKLLLKHLNSVKEQFKNEIKTSDGISEEEAVKLRNNYGAIISQAEDSFREEYLTNHSPVYPAKKDNPKVLREFSGTNNDNNYVMKNGERRGFRHEKARGVNTQTTNGKIRNIDEILANSAHKVVSNNPNNNDSGYCLTGVKEAMKNAGIDITGMEEKGNTPKYVKNWFDEMASKGVFTKIEYVAVDDKNAREINQSDIMRLPAGCFVIFVPDSEGDFKSQAGHIAITNGYGQGYADATDNLAWAQYSNNNDDSGKGEHGKFYVYKLSDKWVADATTGKLKFNG